MIEDEVDLANITARMLKRYGYDVQIVSNCEEAFEMLTLQKFHLVLLDINLPDGSGFDICHELRKVSKIPVIFASARNDETDKITGLDIGGDDYISKPYSLREVLSRINALMRRTYGSEVQDKVYHIGNIEVDTGTRIVRKNQEEIKLALKEFDVLAYLCAHSGTIVSKEQLLCDVWGAFSQIESASVAVHIRWLREKLEDDPSHPMLIETIWGIGYRMKKLEDNI